MTLVLRPRVAGLVVSICALMVAPSAAQAWMATVHVHGAGKVVETTPAHLMDCTVGPAQKSDSSVQDCTAGTTGGDYGQWWTVNLQAQVPQTAADRGWVFSHWVDGNGPGQIDCVDSPDHTGARSDVNCNFVIGSNVSIDLYFDDISGPQDTTITSAAQPSPTSSTSASFTFNAASDPDATFECKLDRPGQAGFYYTCGGPFDKGETLSGLTTSGSYTFSVRGKDPSGNYDSTPASQSWTIDATPPTTTIAGGPAEGSVANSRSAAFSLSASEAVSRYECSLDGGGFATCSSTPSFSSLGDGAHTFQARSVDQVSNLGPAATRHWTVDATAPDTSISSGPADGSTTSANAASFAFASEPGASFQCALDGGPFSGCTSPFSTPALADGAHTFAVRATDAAGNVDGSPAARGWTVSTPASTGGSTPTSTGSTTSTDTSTQAGGSAPAGTGIVPVVAITAATPGVAPGAVSVAWFVAGAKTSAKSLKVTRLKSGSTVRTTCKGKGCPFSSKTLTAKAGKVDLTKYFKGRKLAKKTVLELRVAASGLLTRVFTYKVRAGAAPSRATGCLAAGASKPGVCPAA